MVILIKRCLGNSSLTHHRNQHTKATMNTKHWSVIAGILFLVACLSRAAEPPLPIVPETTSFYGSEFSIDGFVGTATTDFNDERSFTGFGVNLFLNDNFGIGASSSFNDLNGQFIDNVSLRGIYRVPIGRTALYGFAGGLRHLEADKWGVTLGGGVEHRFSRWFNLFGEIGIEKFVDIDPVAVVKTGFRLPLSLKR